jgi:hypothetical protein
MNDAGYTTWGFNAREVLNAVEQWDPCAYLARETEQLKSGCRLDGVLLPAGYEAKHRSIVGIEVKVSRADFLVGLKSGQYDRYAELVPAMYVATPRGVCKTTEIPKSCGHLVVGRRWKQGPMCVCRRKAPERQVEIDNGTLWCLVWRCFQLHERDRLEAERAKRSADKVFGEAIGRRLATAMRAIEQNLETLTGKEAVPCR